MDCGRFSLNEETVHVVSKLRAGWVPPPVCEAVPGAQGEFPRGNGVCRGVTAPASPPLGPCLEQAALGPEKALRPSAAAAPSAAFRRCPRRPSPPDRLPLPRHSGRPSSAGAWRRAGATDGGHVGAGHTGQRATALAPLRARFWARAGPRGPGVLTLGVAGRGAELRHSRTARSEGPRPPRASTLRRRWGGRLSPA